MQTRTPQQLQDRRDQILEAARRCFARDGFHATSMDQVIAEAGLWAGAVYRYFKSKDELIAASAAEAGQLARDAFDELLDTSPPPSPGQVADRVLGDLVRASDRDGYDLTRLALQVWGEAMRSPAMLALAQDARHDLRRGARRRHAARRLHHPLHRRPVADPAGPDRRHQRAGGGAALRRPVQRGGDRERPGGRRQDPRRADRCLRPGPALQPRAVRAGRARPGPATGQLGGGAGGRAPDRRADRPGRLRPADPGQHRRLDPHHPRLLPGRARPGGQRGGHRGHRGHAAYEEALQLLHDMRWEDNSMGSNFLYDWNSINQAFAAGQIGMYVSGGGNYGSLVSQNAIEPADYGETVLPLEGEDAGVLGGGTLAVVRADADDAVQEAAVRWIDFFYMRKLFDQDSAVRFAQTQAESDQPVGAPEVPVFDRETYEQTVEWIGEYINVPTEQMEPYTSQQFDQPLLPEPARSTQELYAELDPVVQAVLTDENADIPALLQQADGAIQAVLDNAG